MGYPVYYNGEVNVAPPLTEDHAALVSAVLNREQTGEAQAVFAAIAADPKLDIPFHACLLEVSEDRGCLRPEEGESRHGVRLWLELLLQYVMVPHGYTLTGEILWEAEDAEDRGGIFVKDNHLETVDDLIFNAGPSWAPNHYVDDVLKQAIQRLLDSADGAGCSPDLTVVDGAHLETLRSLLP